MANFNLVIDSKFKPFSFQELAAPYIMYKTEYDKQAAAFDDLQVKANIWDNLASETEDPRTHAQYKAYADSLRSAASDLAVEGMSFKTRSNLMDLKADYSKKITPIEQAYQRKQQLAKEQREGKAKGLIYNYYATDTSLDNFVFDNQKDYESLDLNTLYTKAKDTFSSLSKELTAYGKGKPIDAYMNTFVQKYGITRAQAQAFADSVRNGTLDKYMQSEEALPILNSIYSSLYGQTGVDSWDNDTAKSQVRDTILSGVNSAIGQSTVQAMENKGAVLAAEHNSRMAAAGTSNNLPTLDLRLPGKRNAVSQTDRKKALEDYDIVKNYVYKDNRGHWHMNEAGRKKYSAKSEYVYKLDGMGEPIYVKQPNQFKATIDKLGLSGIANNRLGAGQNAILDNIQRVVNDNYDGNLYTENYRKIDNADFNKVISTVRVSKPDGIISDYDWVKTGKGQVLQSTGKKIDFNKLSGKNIKDIIAVVGKNGSYYEITIGDAQNTKIRVPIETVTRNYSHNDYVRGFDILNDMKSRGVTTDPLGNSIEDVELNDYNNWIDDIIGIAGTTKTKTNTVEQTRRF